MKIITINEENFHKVYNLIWEYEWYLIEIDHHRFISY